MIAFGAGVAVGANWEELRKKIGPLLGTLGLKVSDLGDFLSATNRDGFDVPRPARSAKKPRTKKTPAAKKKANVKIPNGIHSGVSSVSKGKPAAVRRNGHRPPMAVPTEALSSA
jgi:hypothetical protein